MMWQKSKASPNSFHWSRVFISVHTIKSPGNTEACSLISPPSPLPPFCGFTDEWKVLSQSTAPAISLPNLGLQLKATACPSVAASRDKTAAARQEDTVFSRLWFSLQMLKKPSLGFKSMLNIFKITYQCVDCQQVDKKVWALQATLAFG